MHDVTDHTVQLPPEQQAIRARCFHPNGTFVPFPRADLKRSIPKRFEEQVRQHSGHLAVKSRRYSFSYSELNQMANRLAHAVVTRCGGKEATIALLCEHDTPLLAAMLAVLKAGKIYVPLDPAYPRARLTYMVEDSRARLLVTDRANRSLATALAQEDLYVIDLNELDTGLDAENPGLHLEPDTPAFILYTSGSTGQPKGFLQTHGNVLHDAMHYTNAAHFCTDDRFVLISSCSFADSVRTIYAALLNGASLYPFDIKKEGLMHLASWLIQHKITVYRSVPTVFRHFGATLSGNEAFPHLRLIYLGGEPVYKRDVNIYRAAHTPIEKALAQIWTEVLNLKQVGIHDNFLELGGNSLLAMQILSRVIRRFQVDLSLQAFLETSTVAEMALLIIQHQTQQTGPDTMDRILAEVQAPSKEQTRRLAPGDSDS